MKFNFRSLLKKKTVEKWYFYYYLSQHHTFFICPCQSHMSLPSLEILLVVVHVQCALNESLIFSPAFVGAEEFSSTTRQHQQTCTPLSFSRRCRCARRIMGNLRVNFYICIIPVPIYFCLRLFIYCKLSPVKSIRGICEQIKLLSFSHGNSQYSNAKSRQPPNNIVYIICG